MKFKRLSIRDEVNTDNDRLNAQYRSGRGFGSVTVSDDFLFVKKGFMAYFISYEHAERIFRRVRLVHTSVCCGKGDFQVEYLTVQADGKELIEVQLPGNKAAKLLMEELKKRASGLDTNAPARADVEPEDAKALAEAAR